MVELLNLFELEFIWIELAIYFVLEISCNIINIVNVTFDKFNLFLLNKNIYLKTNILTQTFWMLVYIVQSLEKRK